MINSKPLSSLAFFAAKNWVIGYWLDERGEISEAPGVRVWPIWAFGCSIALAILTAPAAAG